MNRTNLATRFLEGFEGQGLDVDEVRFAADFGRLMVRTFGLVRPSDGERKVLSNCLLYTSPSPRDRG